MAHALTKADGAYPLYDLSESGQITSYIEVLRFGLRWEPVKAERKGLLGRAERKLREQQGNTDPADLDGGAIFCTSGDPKKYLGFGNMDPFKDESTEAERKSVKHSGDSVRGDGDGDDEYVDLTLAGVPKRYDGILLVGGAYKSGSDMKAVRDVKATVYDGTGGSFDAVGEFEPSLLGVKRMIAVASLKRDPANNMWSLSIVNESYDITPGSFESLLQGAIRRS